MGLPRFREANPLLIGNAAKRTNPFFLERYLTKQPSEAPPATVSSKPAAQLETPFHKIPRLILADSKARHPECRALRIPSGGKMASVKSVEERFWAKVDKTEGCWNWTAAKFWNGYGHLGRQDGGTPMAHRISYELCVGTIPTDLVLDHICHNRACVKPAHLRAVTQKQNVENLPGLKRTNKSGFTGVTWVIEKRKWRASVGHNRKRVHVGYFERAEDAHIAALAKRNELHTHNDLDRVA